MFIRATKGIVTLIVGFIKPVKNVINPCETTFRCHLKGVTSSEGDHESWKELFGDFKEYVLRGGN